MSNRKLRRAVAAGIRSGAWGEWEERVIPKAMVAGTAMENLQRAVLNEKYSVQIYQCATPWGFVLQLSIRRHDGAEIHCWDDMQRIKNELVGEHVTAVEVFPSVDDIVDQAPMRHMWALPDSVKLPFGLHKASAWGRR